MKPSLAIILALVAWVVFRAGAAAGSPKFETVFRLTTAQGAQRLVTRGEVESRGLKEAEAAFVGVSASTWPEGLVPVFSIEEDGGFELRRLPQRGRENYTEPLFFAIPCEDEPDVRKISGTWNCVATNEQGSRHYPAWQLTMDREHIAGRFDQQTEYRFAYVSGGAFRSNRFELKIEYINDHYTLAGEWREGKLRGTWLHEGAAERGTWEAERPGAAPALSNSTKLVPLYEWRRTGETTRRYATEDLQAPGWQRATRPLCRVWPLK